MRSTLLKEISDRLWKRLEIGRISVSSNVEPLHGSAPTSTPLYRRSGESPSSGSRLVAMPSPGDRYALLAEASLRQRSTRIAIKAKGRILFINAEDVVAVEACGNYSVLLCTSASHRLRESISTLEKTLRAHGFLRIHRSVLVNAALVEEIQPWPTGEYALRVKGGKEYTVTRTYKKHLHILAQLWIGMDGFAAG
jgi:DNA-binding LytR/AlgR family response regulator